jgi:hypothetical protein
LPQALLAGYTSGLPAALLSLIQSSCLLEYAWSQCVSAVEDVNLPVMLPAPIERFLFIHQPPGLPGIEDSNLFLGPSHVYHTMWGLAMMNTQADTDLVKAELPIWNYVRTEFLAEYPTPSDEGLRSLLATPARTYCLRLAFRAIMQTKVFPSEVMRDILQHDRCDLLMAHAGVFQQLEQRVVDLKPEIVAEAFPIVFETRDGVDLLGVALQNGHTWRVVHLLQEVARIQADSHIKRLHLDACLRRCVRVVTLRQDGRVHDSSTTTYQAECHVLALASEWFGLCNM